MVLKDYITHFQTALQNEFSDSEIHILSDYVFEHLTNIHYKNLSSQLQQTISIDITALNTIIKRIQQHEPIQYIVQKSEFYGLVFFVNESVLIPRPETEELVSIVLENIDISAPLRILDIGTGSGCIAIALKKQLSNATMYAMDISKNALEIAEKNAQKNNVSIEFICADILDWEKLNFKNTFDIIVSNPPYIPTKEIPSISNNVLSYEPHLALFVEDSNPFIFYEKIIDFGKEYLTPNGILFFETDIDFIPSYRGLNIKRINDFSNNPRFAICDFVK